MVALAAACGVLSCSLDVLTSEEEAPPMLITRRREDGGR